MKGNIVKIEEKIHKEKVKSEHLASSTRKKNQVRAIQQNYSDNDNDAKWWRLDNAALLFPAVTSKKVTNVFRLAANLKEPVDKDALQRASDKIFERLPALNVGLRNGLFWSYFEELPYMPQVKEERSYPMQQFKKNRKKHLLRIMYYKNKIILEIFHSIADGVGASKILTYLLIAYFMELGIKTISTDFDLNDFQKEEEIEDSFSKYADLKTFEKRDSEKAYQIKGSPLPYDKLYEYLAFTSISQIKEVAKKYNYFS